MREILFRGKSVDCVHENEWIYGYYNKHRGGLDDEYHDYILTEYQWNFRVDPDTVGQFTGLLDKNGNKIFEGDIVRFVSERYYLFAVEMENFEWVLKSKTMPLYKHRLEKDDLLEIVGNKWDNPELLNP